MSVGLIIPAAGSGERLGQNVPKALAVVGSRTLIAHALRMSARAGVIDHVVIAAPPGEIDAATTAAAGTPGYTPEEQIQVVEGGPTRQESVRLAVEKLPSDTAVTLVHDAARCFAPPQVFRDVVSAVESGHDAVVPAVTVVDTLKQVDADGRVVATPDRSSLRAVQTPQGFATDALLVAHRRAADAGLTQFTDDAGLLEWDGVAVIVVPGHADAFKITHPQDIQRAELILVAWEANQ